jgi:transcription antitermination factor NusG
MTETPIAALWFALQVRTRWEGSIASFLSGKGYDVFLPTYTASTQRTKRIREIQAPLFPGYVFCRFEVEKRLPILVTPGVVAVVGRGRVPIPIDDTEIAAIRTVVSSGLQAEPFPYLEIGQRVRITSGSLAGVEGLLLNFKGHHRIVVSVSLLRRSVAMEIDRSCAVPVLPSSVLQQPASSAVPEAVVA